MFRYWPGTYDVCIENEIYGGAISRFDSDIGCETGVKVDAIPPVNMTSLSGMTACGRRGGPNFVETVRVDPYTLECPQGLEPCSEFTNANDTVCMEPYKKEYECPIIDLFVIKDD